MCLLRSGGTAVTSLHPAVASRERLESVSLVTPVTASGSGDAVRAACPGARSDAVRLPYDGHSGARYSVMDPAEAAHFPRVAACPARWPMGPALRQREGGRTWSLLRAPFMVQMRPAGSSGPVPRWTGTTRHACQGAATLAAFAAVSWPAAGGPPAVAGSDGGTASPMRAGRHRGGLPRGRRPGQARVRLCPPGRRCPLGSRRPARHARSLRYCWQRPGLRGLHRRWPCTGHEAFWWPGRRLVAGSA